MDTQTNFNFTNINWKYWKKKLVKQYKHCLEEKGQPNIIPIDRNANDTEIEAYITTITELIKNNTQMNLPKIRRCNNMECYTNRTIELLYKHKSRIISVLKRIKRRGGTTNAQQVLGLKTEIKRTNELIFQNIKIEVNKQWKLKLEAIKPGPKMYSNIHKFSRQKAEMGINKLEIDENEANNMSAINLDWSKITKAASTYISTNTRDNLNILGFHIEQHTIKNHALGKSAHETVINQKIEPLKALIQQNKLNNRTKINFNANNKANAPTYSTGENYFVTVPELISILNCLNTKKSYGMDNIPCIVLKHLPEEIINELCSLFNQLLNNKAFPDCWKTARIFPILKRNKNPFIPESYRPISLLSNLSKVYEIIILNKLQQHAIKNDLLPDNQFGFRHQHSTIHAISKLTSDICYNLNDKKCTGAVLIDMDKAFESVWLDGLIYKMTKMKFDPEILEILMEMLYNRKFVTTNGTETSSLNFTIHNGLQQGSITAPLLFNLYIKDLVANMNLNNDNIQTIGYADDLVIYCSKPKIETIQQTLQTAVNFVVDYLHTWRVKVNIGKCEAILFRKPVHITSYDTRKNYKQFKIKINNETIENKAMVKYLGIHIDQFCYLNNHINIQLEKARKAFLSNKKIFYNRYIDSKVKEICYQQLIRPIIVYGCPIWFNLNPGYMEKIRKFERRCIRYCRGVHRKAETGYRHYISNQTQYNNFKPNRIDLHIIYTIRNHILRSMSCTSNSLISLPYYTNSTILANSIQTNNIPGPEAFIYLDKIGYIQDNNQTPIIYHVVRKPNEKGFNPTKFGNPEQHLRYSVAMKKLDQPQFERNKYKFWWLREA